MTRDFGISVCQHCQQPIYRTEDLTTMQFPLITPKKGVMVPVNLRDYHVWCVRELRQGN